MRATRGHGAAAGSRRPALTAELRGRIVAAVRAGAQFEVAARAAGVSRSTLQRWRARGAREREGPYRELHEALVRAEAECEVRQLVLINRAGEHNFRAAAPGKLRHGPGAALHAILDRVVDDYQPALDGLTDDVEQVEQQVFSGGRSNPAQRIYKLKREVVEFHRAAAPLVDPVDRLARGQYELVHPEVRTYLRDVNDHLLRVREQLDALRDLLTSVLAANLTQFSVRQNDDVRRISAWAAIVAVPTMIAGIYGMNFEHMPELDWTFGYPLALALMLVVCALLYRNFKRVGWL